MPFCSVKQSAVEHYYLQVLISKVKLGMICKLEVKARIDKFYKEYMYVQ